MSNSKNKKLDGRWIEMLELLIDIFLITVATFIVSIYYENIDLFNVDLTWTNINELMFTAIYVIIPTIVFFRIYEATVTEKDYLSVMFSVIIALFFGNLLALGVSNFIPGYPYNPYNYILIFLLQLILIGAFKALFWKILKHTIKKQSLVVGPKSEVDLIVKKIIAENKVYVDIKYLYYNDIHMDEEQLYNYVQKVDVVYLASGLEETQKGNILNYCLAEDEKNVILIPKLHEISILNAKIHQADDMLGFRITSLHLSLEQRFFKRVFDIVISLIGLVCALPFFIIIPVLMLLFDRGPLLFKQQRVTIDNKKFTLYKYRTMIVDAEKETGAVLASRNDKRITTLGKFMRATRLDELPQLFNVIKGDMSIVGPRPERQIFIDKFTEENPHFKYRVNVKAGITGLAQSLGKYDTTFENKLRFDLMYIRNYSLFYDLKIILYTIRALFDKTSSQGTIDETISLEDIGVNLLVEKVEDNVIKIKHIK